MESIGYGVTDALREGRLMVFSRFGTIAEAKSDVGLNEVLNSPAVEEADVIILDSASALMPDDLDEKQRFDMMQKLRKNNRRRSLNHDFALTQMKWTTNSCTT